MGEKSRGRMMRNLNEDATIRASPFFLVHQALQSACTAVLRLLFPADRGAPIANECQQTSTGSVCAALPSTKSSEQSRTRCGQSGGIEDQPQYRWMWRRFYSRDDATTVVRTLPRARKGGHRFCPTRSRHSEAGPGRQHQG
jgi:hypothetical protein